MSKARSDAWGRGRAGKKNIRPDAELFQWWCRRWGYIPMQEEIAALVGVTPSNAGQKINHRGFWDTEKILLAKEFELTAQEFVDLFYPGCFHPDGRVVLDRDVRYKDMVYERSTDVFPLRSLK